MSHFVVYVVVHESHLSLSKEAQHNALAAYLEPFDESADVDPYHKAREKVAELFDAKDGGRKLIASVGVALLPASTEVVDAVPAKKARGR